MVNNELDVIIPDSNSNKVNMDKLIRIASNLNEEEMEMFIMMGNAVLMEKNIMCGKE